jgi:uncharacterized protein YndB with AHSA1/START domain
MNPTNTIDAIIKEIVIKAPAEKVFEALADPSQRVQWWGAEGRFQATHMESDLRLGGAWQMRGTGPEGKPFTLRGQYRTIERPRLLEFTWLADFEDAASQSVVRFDLEEKDGATTVRLTHSGFASERARNTYQGWPWLLALLQAYVENKVAGSAA